MMPQEEQVLELTPQRSEGGLGHLFWTVSLSIVMFGLGFLAGSRWAEQKAGESERVVVGRLIPPQVEVSPPEPQTADGTEQEGRIWNILTGKESPGSALPGTGAVGEGSRQAGQLKPKVDQQRGTVAAPSNRPATTDGASLSSAGGPSQSKSAAAVSPGAGPGAGTRYAVQVISVQTKEKAESIARELNGKGYPLVRIVSGEVPGRGVWYRVWAGSFERKEDAESLGKRIQEKERLQPQVVLERRH